MQSHQQLFTNLPDNSRVWIYQSNRPLTEQETQQASALIKEFVQRWTSHSEKVVADGAVVYNQFIVLVADETFVSLGGCSIDSSVKVMRQLEEQFGITLFDRLTVTYRENGTIKTASQSNFQELFEQGIVNENTIVFNNLVPTLKDFREKWETPLAKSWHARIFSVEKQ